MYNVDANLLVQFPDGKYVNRRDAGNFLHEKYLLDCYGNNIQITNTQNRQTFRF